MSESYKAFFDQVVAFKIEQNKQRQRGLNNYNILTSVLKPSDEVRLHSRMIFSLLNPNGSHYQGNLFLEKFLEILKVDGFTFDSENSSVYKEYQNIDLYITDGDKHIIIENKIYANDQRDQIKKYIEIIKSENKDVNCDDILVIYLSLDRDKPSSFSLGGLEIRDDYIFENNAKTTKYKSIHYKNEVMIWLEKCRFEVQNITNLNQAIKQYIDVVKIINNEYKDKVMNLADYIKNNESIYKIAIDVHKTLPQVRENIVNNFFNDLVEKLQVELGELWVIEISGDLSKRYSFPFRIYREEWGKKNNLIFAFEFSKNNYYAGHFGIVRCSDKVDIKGDLVKKFKSEISSLNFNLKTTAWWLHWEWLPNSGENDDFAEYIVFNKNAEKNFINRITDCVELFETKSNLLSEINNYLEK